MSSVDRIERSAPLPRAREARPAEARLLSAIDQRCADRRLDDPTQAQFKADWSLKQQFEILALVGTCHTISFVANVARLPSEDFGAPFLSRRFMLGNG